jgi:hypothetical protein
MVDIKSKTCIYEGCKKHPTFNYEGETQALYCNGHKLENMVDIKSKTCIYEGCKTRPCFNFEGETKALYCNGHKLENMFDIKSKTCIHEGCKKQPVFNYEGETQALYCSIHKSENMLNVKSRNCIHEGCKTQPVFNYEGETKALYCSTHKLDNMVDIKSKTCKNEWCKTSANYKYDGYCMNCFIHMFPDRPVTRNYKTKERSVVEFVQQHFSNFNWMCDQRIQDGCSRKRPDLLCDLGYQVVIIEIDENQHIDYDCSCENKRIMELSQDVGHRPLVFIRFNPDDYTQNSKNVSSCWGLNKLGVCVIKKSKVEEWNERLNTLKNQIEYWLTPENQTSKTVEVIQLFYDM